MQNGLEVLCRKIFNLLLHKLARVCAYMYVSCMGICVFALYSM